MLLFHGTTSEHSVAGSFRLDGAKECLWLWGVPEFRPFQRRGLLRFLGILLEGFEPETRHPTRLQHTKRAEVSFGVGVSIKPTRLYNPKSEIKHRHKHLSVLMIAEILSNYMQGLARAL